MPIPIECDACGKRYRAGERYAGRRVKCKVCGRPIEVPGETSPSGSPIYRHEARERGFELAIGDGEAIEKIDRHIEEHLGPVAMVFHELISDLVHIDIHQVAPSEDRPYWTLITSGMSDRPMNTPEGADVPRFAELILSLPTDWPMEQSAWKDERWYWPIRWLKVLSRLPHEYRTWLGWGHTVPNGEPAEPFADGTKFCGVVMLSPILVPEGFHRLEIDGEKTIQFLAPFPLYKEELAYKLEHGGQALVDLLAEHEVSERIDVRRKNVCKKSRWTF